uniref:Auxin response factor n=1 Tax=Kalanchoe fedtschenkoi TaxID=63787 RepID=A0A7N0UFS1_KALFE
MESCLDGGLWQVCAGNMVQVPQVDSNVVYFPQGHAEHANGIVNFKDFPEIPDMVVCKVSGVKHMADVETDELFLRLRLVPLRISVTNLELEEDNSVGHVGQDALVKSASVSKTLTQSDANNGGGFSVPRFCADSFFPRLDYTADPPVQTLHIKDVHGKVWKFRHIFRGTPRRHLLTTGWSSFVNHKQLVAGDSVVFMKAADGELFIGTRRAKRGTGGGKAQCGWTPAGGICDWPDGGGCRMFENGTTGTQMSYGCSSVGGKVSVESVLEAALLAAGGKAFEVNYYPRATSAEFCVKASAVSAALRTQWRFGMKFKMPFETEDASRVSWFVGTIVAAQAADPLRWPKSPWRLLQVTWDEPDLLHSAKRVNPWMADLVVSGMPNMHLVPFSLPMKRLRPAQSPDLPLSSLRPAPLHPRNPFVSHLSYHPVADNEPADIQGARHVQCTQYPMNFHLNNVVQPFLFPQFRPPQAAPPPPPGGVNLTRPQRNEDMSCLLTLGNHPETPMKNETKTTSTSIVLFGKHIHAEEKKSQGSSDATAILSDVIMEKVQVASEGSRSGSVQNGQKQCSSESRSPCCHSLLSTQMAPQAFSSLALEQTRCHLCRLTI